MSCFINKFMCMFLPFKHTHTDLQTCGRTRARTHALVPVHQLWDRATLLRHSSGCWNAGINAEWLDTARGETRWRETKKRKRLDLGEYEGRKSDGVGQIEVHKENILQERRRWFWVKRDHWFFRLKFVLTVCVRNVFIIDGTNITVCVFVCGQHYETRACENSLLLIAEENSDLSAFKNRKRNAWEVLA